MRDAGDAGAASMRAMRGRQTQHQRDNQRKDKTNTLSSSSDDGNNADTQQCRTGVKEISWLH